MPASSDFVAAVQRQIKALGIAPDDARDSALANELATRERFKFGAEWGSPGLLEYDAPDIRAALEIKLADELAEPATVKPKETKTETQLICEAFDLSPEAWRATPPSDKLRLRSELAGKVAADAAEKNATDLLAEKVQSGKATPTERLEYARRTGATGPTREQRRSPMWALAQETTMSLTELRKAKHGHDIVAASAMYPDVKRADHRRHSERLAGIIAQRESAGET